MAGLVGLLGGSVNEAKRGIESGDQEAIEKALIAVANAIRDADLSGMDYWAQLGLKAELANLTARATKAGYLVEVAGGVVIGVGELFCLALRALLGDTKAKGQLAFLIAQLVLLRGLRRSRASRRQRTTGARETELRPDQWRDAEKAYDAIRETDDVSTVAKNTGWSEQRIQTIKDHLFFRKHRLDTGFKRFDADPRIANAWHRLREGTHTKGDLRLLEHELFEARFEGIHGTDYRTAHDAADRSGRPSGLE